MCQGQLRHLGRHAAVVINERDDPSVQRSLGRLIQPTDGFRVSLVFLADAARRARRRGDPGQAQSASGEVSVKFEKKKNRFL